MTPGTKLAKIVNIGLDEAGTGTLSVVVTFEFEESGPKKIKWHGYLSPLSIERTMDILKNVIGFNGDDETDQNSNFKSSTWDHNRQVNIVLENETYQGNTRLKVKWINSLDSAQNFKRIQPETVKGKLQSIGFKAAYMSAGRAESSDFAKDETLPF